ncbi:MAG: histidinol-phosphate transaminase [Acidobacteria bacterium]|nr:histidinol-phosphate transaminase [Acidobacteriota bacterium]
MKRPRVRDDLVQLEGYHSPQVDVDVRLNTNEAPVPPPDGFRDAVAAELSRVDWNRYPDRAATALREAIAEHHGVDPAQVFAANGSNEVLQSICLAYGGAGRWAVDFQPTYLMHAQIASVTGTSVRHGRRLADFTLDPDEARRTVQENDADITFLCSPNNPTGMVEPPEVLKAVIEAAPGVVVVDEAYGQFADWSAVLMLDEDLPMVVTRTFSKTWSMAAARLGYLLGPTWLVAELEKVVLPYHLDALKQAVGIVALRYEAEMHERVAALVAERERLVAAMDQLPLEQWPSGANFILFRPRDRPGRNVWQELLDRSVLVRDTSSWPGLEGCLRVTVGTTAEDDAFLAALTEVLS